MSITTTAAQFQANYNNDEEAVVAAFSARNRDMMKATLGSLASNFEKHPEDAFPFSGDHLNTVAIRDDFGDEVARERRVA